MNTPNKLTVFRIILAPVFFTVLLLNIKYSFLFAELIFVVAAITDFIDGKLARSNNQITTLGKLLDPLADKMLVTAALLGLMHFGFCSHWIVFVVLTREYAVTSMRMIALSQNIVIPANIWGKIKTASQMVSVILVLLLGGIEQLGVEMPISLSIIGNVLFGITAVFAVVSGIVYIIDASKKINFNENK